MVWSGFCFLDNIVLCINLCSSKGMMLWRALEGNICVNKDSNTLWLLAAVLHPHLLVPRFLHLTIFYCWCECQDVAI